MQNLSVKLSDVRVRREILIQAQRFLQKIDENEDLLDRYLNFDLPTFQTWFDLTFANEKLQIELFERDYAQSIEFHNSMVALVKLRKVTMPRAFEILKAEQASYAAGSPSTRTRIETERLKREQYIRADLEATHLEIELVEPDIQPSSPLQRPVSNIEAEQLKIVYRKLVRRLHPDLQGPNVDPGELRWQKRIWNLLLQARGRGDVLEIERLYKVTLLRQMEFSELSLQDAQDVHLWLSVEMQRLETELWHAQQNPGWEFSKVQDLRILEARSRERLTQEIAQLQHEISELKGQHAYLEVLSCKTPTRRKRSPVAVDANQLSLF